MARQFRNHADHLMSPCHSSGARGKALFGLPCGVIETCPQARRRAAGRRRRNSYPAQQEKMVKENQRSHAHQNWQQPAVAAATPSARNGEDDHVYGLASQQGDGHNKPAPDGGINK
jgi:hypothetical protein